MNEDVNQETGASITGTITVSVNLKGSKRRYSPPDIKAEIPINFGGKITEVESLVDAEMEAVKSRILIACGKKTVEE